jgi:polar amino acid transport system substrate-binding protein
MQGRRTKLRRLALALLLPAGLIGPAAEAACSRAIDVPVSPAGRLVFVEDDRVEGVLPELIRERGALIGCEFRFSVVPRARAARTVFELQEGDLYVPALRRPERDRTHVFVPLSRQGVAVATLRTHAPVPTNLGQLLADRSLRGIFVRGYYFGQAYGDFIDQLLADKRADLVPDIETLSRMLRAGRADFTLLPHVTGQGALDLAPRMPLAQTAFRIELLEGLAPMENGVYLARRNLGAADLALLTQMFERAIADGALRRAYLRHYPAELVEQLRF